MASIKKGTVSTPPSYASWWKHLRRYGKQAYWRAERKAAKQEYKKQEYEPQT